MSGIPSVKRSDLVRLLPRVPKDANKYTRGQLTLVAGCDEYPGAAALASRAAQESGAGYVQTYVQDSVQNVVRVMCGPSLVVRPWSAWDVQKATPSDSGHPRAYAFGSGFDGDDGKCRSLALDAVCFLSAPLLLDGGALRAISTQGGVRACSQRGASGRVTVVTPHGGEAAGLARAAGISAESPADLAREIACAYGCFTVLKGPDTYISDGKRTVVMTFGTPALAKAGTGDVLAGIIGALMAQGMDAFDAGALGASVHALAGVRASDEKGVTSVRPEDVADQIPYVFCELEHERQDNE